MENNNETILELNRKWKTYVEEPEHRIFFLFDTHITEDFRSSEIKSVRKHGICSIGFKSNNATYITTKFEGRNDDTYWGFTVIFNHINRHEYIFDITESEYHFLEEFCRYCSIEKFLN